MFSAVFSGSLDIFKRRWKPLLGMSAITIGMYVLLALLMVLPVAHAMRGLAANVQPTVNAPASTQFDGTTGAAGSAGSTGTFGAPLGSGSVGTGSASLHASPSAVLGKIALPLLLFTLIGIPAAMAVYTASVAVAMGGGIGESLKHGFASVVHLHAQLLVVSWQPIAAMVAAIVLGMLNPLLGVVGVLVPLCLTIANGGRTLAVLGAVAAGDRSWKPDHALRLLAGSRAMAGYLAFFVLALATGVLSAIPVIGVVGGLVSMMMSPAAVAAFYDAIGGTGGGTGPDALHPGPGSSTHAPHVLSSSIPVAVSAVPAAHAPAATAVAPAAAPTPPPQPVAGPSWDGVLHPGSPWGTWLSLPAPGQVQLQVAWSDGPAVLVQHADQSGAWTTPVQQPTSSGHAIAIDLPAGLTYVALSVLSGTPQAVRLASILPPGASAAPPAQAA